MIGSFGPKALTSDFDRKVQELRELEKDGVSLPYFACTIAGIEAEGYIVDLETGDLIPYAEAQLAYPTTTIGTATITEV